MLRLALQARCKAEQLIFAGIPERDNLGDAEAPFGQRASLVKDNGLEAACPLKSRAVSDQETVAR